MLEILTPWNSSSQFGQRFITLKAIALTLVCDPQLQLAPALEADSLLVKHNQLWHTLCSLFLRLVIECVDIDLGNAAVYRVSNTIE